MHEAKRQRQKKIAERTNLRKQVCCHFLNFGSFDCAVTNCHHILVVVVVDIICEQINYCFRILKQKRIGYFQGVGNDKFLIMHNDTRYQYGQVLGSL